MGRVKTIRRVIGAVSLTAAVVMLIAGETRPAGSSPTGFAVYWLVCFLFAALAMGAAILDLGAVRREARAEQRDLLKHTLLDIEAEKERRSKSKDNRDKDGLRD